ncbi:MAG TPA: dockerin type I domain-containing protein [Acetivibrio sp.]|uniref:RCC1 domain-containing protein n=1 Tax=Acetivibrio sp. TaxID=1872092 RepID=UPI002B5AC725|nr:dockerin type I domain-containing protein [Acetivibrio sp.]HOM03209.1 dockerin type I domain-containing protein [Acetivibrio sp.]
MSKCVLKKIVCLLVILCFVTVSGAASIFAAGSKSALLGDVDGDSKVDSRDLMLIKKYILKLKDKDDFSAEGIKAADVNADGEINSIDFSWLKKYLLRAVDKLPGEVDKSDGSIVRFQSGYAHSVILKNDGTVWVLGDNGKGQLGLGDTPFEDKPVMIDGLTGIKSVAAGSEHTLALDKDGTLWAWGNNYSLQLIEYTERDPVTRERTINTPIKVETHSDIKYVAANYSRTLIIKNDGTVWLHSLPPISSSKDAEYLSWEIKGLGDIKMADIGTGHVVVLREDGTVWTWGENVWGQLGNGAQQHHNVYTYIYFEPNQAKNLTDIVSVAAGQTHSVALKSDGTVWTWGGNFYGELGNGSTNYILEPQKIEGLEDVVAVDAGSSHTVALRADGTVWVWGKNDFGQLGNGTTMKSTVPIKVEGLTGVIAVQAGMECTIAYKNDGTVWAWGKNDFGQLGDGTFENRLRPVKVFDNE